MPTAGRQALGMARGFILSLFLLLGWLCANASAQPDNQSRPPLPAPNALVLDESQSFADLIREVILHEAKEGYADEKHWNKTSDRFDGLKIRGLKISKRKKKVRHGFCRKYEAQLVRPEETFKLEIEQLPPSDDNSATTFVISSQLKARSEATFAQYLYGVKGLNGNAVANATLTMKIVLEIAPQAVFSFESPLPDFNINADVKDVQLRLKHFDLQKLGPIKGELAQIIGDGSEKAVEALLKRQESRIKKKIQKELDEIDRKDEKR